MSRKSDRKGERELNLTHETYKEVPKDEHSISPSKLLFGKIKDWQFTHENWFKIVESHSIVINVQLNFFPCFVDTFSFIS